MLKKYTIGLKKEKDIYIDKKLSMSLKQKATANAFGHLWRYSSVYDIPFISEKKDQHNVNNVRSGKKFQKFANKYFTKKKRIKFLDVGCGHGHLFKIYFSKYIKKLDYVGFDVHPDLQRTFNFLKPLFSKYKKKPIIVRASMNKIPKNKIFKNFDFVWADGTLHHSDSVESGINQISRVIKSGGYFIFWIINKQKPLRKITDNFFRDVSEKIKNPKKYENELEEISRLSIAFGKSLGNDKVRIRKNIETLKLNPGTYKLQEILYDYIIKLFYNKSLSFKRHVNVHWDWFRPPLYHQTSTKDLKRYLKKNKFIITSHTEKTNGHFVICRKK